MARVRRRSFLTEARAAERAQGTKAHAVLSARGASARLAAASLARPSTARTCSSEERGAARPLANFAQLCPLTPPFRPLLPAHVGATVAKQPHALRVQAFVRRPSVSDPTTRLAKRPTRRQGRTRARSRARSRTRPAPHPRTGSPCTSPKRDARLGSRCGSTGKCRA